MAATLLAGCTPPNQQDAEPQLRDTAVEKSDIQADLDELIEEVENERDVNAGLAISGENRVLTAGVEGMSPAWSTIKVPIAIAALRDGADESLVDLAIKESDNDAASALWSQVVWTEGDPAEVINDMLKHYDAEADINTAAFGYSEWPLKQQANFGRQIECIPEAEYVYEALDDVVDWQKEGLSAQPNTRAKGGWGLSEVDDIYTDRQVGEMTIDGGDIGLAITIEGTEEEESRDALNDLAEGVVEVAAVAVEEGIVKQRTEC